MQSGMHFPLLQTVVKIEICYALASNALQPIFKSIILASPQRTFFQRTIGENTFFPSITMISRELKTFRLGS
jgi:hypothetical protein